MLAAAILAGLGFTAGGIVAGSIAAKLMAIAAVANGGGVVAGSLVAILQSIGKLNYLFIYVDLNKRLSIKTVHI